MAKITASLAQRLGLGVVVMLAILLPLLFYSLERIVDDSDRESFLNHVRGSTRIIADQLEGSELPADDVGLLRVLDSLALSGEITLAEFDIGGRKLRSHLSTATAVPDGDDLAFAQGQGNVYLLSANIGTDNRQLTLRLGFDEAPTQERIALARRRLAIILAAYLAASVLAAMLLSRYLTRPVRQLQAASRRIASGELTAQLAVQSGISEMNELAADLELMRSELVGTTLRLCTQIEERAALESQLRQKQRLETVGTLAGGIAHEINNVLVPITLRTEMAMDALPAGHVARDDLAIALAAARRARDTVSKVLAFARHYDISPPMAQSIAPAVEEALSLIASAKPATVEIRLQIDSQSRAVLADSSSVVHIALNLCSNALQAMSEHGGQLDVTLQNHERDGSLGVLLRVADDGPGMDDATRQRIFEPFFTTRRIGEGTGLGLSVVHGIVTQLNAVIEVQSEPGKGTTFTVFFPC